MNWQIRLNDGTAHEVYHCGAADGVLQVELVKAESVLAVAEEFSNPDKTSKITFLYGEMSTVHEGYIKLISVTYNQYQGSYRLALMKE